MRNKTLITIVFALLLTTSWAQDKKKIRHIEIQTSAVCDMCKETIESELIYLKGVKKVDLDLNTMKVSVDYLTTKTDTTAIKHFIAGLGYDAGDIPATEEAYEKLHECCKKDAHE